MLLESSVSEVLGFRVRGGRESPRPHRAQPVTRKAITSLASAKRLRKSWVSLIESSPRHPPSPRLDTRLPIPKKSGAGKCRKVPEKRVYYGELIRKGGRPWYPIHLIELVSKYPSDSRDLLWAWQEFPDVEEVDLRGVREATVKVVPV